MMENKGLHEFAEKRLGEKLTKRDIAILTRLEKASAKYDAKLNGQTRTISKWCTTRSAVLRYGMTTIIAVVLCLSVVLPITLTPPGGNGNGTPQPPPAQENIRYVRSFSYDTDYETLSKYGFLLFHEETRQIYDTQKASVEYTNQKPGMPLGYLIKESLVVIDDSEAFKMDYRIRTYKYYDFQNYYADFYATLENLYDLKATTIIDDQIFENIDIIEAPNHTGLKRQRDFHAFKVEGIPVFCHVQPSGVLAYIYFVYQNNEYIITLEDEYELGLLDAKYVKDHFIRTLFGNI